MTLELTINLQENNDLNELPAWQKISLCLIYNSLRSHIVLH